MKKPTADPKQNMVAASITIYDPKGFTKAGARAIANWMRERAAELEDPATRKSMVKTFRARYYYGKALES